jgi:Bacteriophage head to tail connecting protein
VDIGDKLMDMERNVINDAFLVTLFQILVDTPQMTATEVLERAREKGMLLAPTAGRMQAEFLGPMIEREIDLLAQQNLLPPIPPMLRGVDIEFKIEYDNPMSRMQRSEKAAGFMRALDVAANYAKNTMDPAPLDWFDFDSAMPEILDIQGAPVAWTRTQDAVDQIRQSRIEQQKQQAMIQAAPGMAAVAKAIPGMTGK